MAYGSFLNEENYVVTMVPVSPGQSINRGMAIAYDSSENIVAASHSSAVSFAGFSLIDCSVPSDGNVADLSSAPRLNSGKAVSVAKNNLIRVAAVTGSPVRGQAIYFNKTDSSFSTSPDADFLLVGYYEYPDSQGHNLYVDPQLHMFTHTVTVDQLSQGFIPFYHNSSMQNRGIGKCIGANYEVIADGDDTIILNYTRNEGLGNTFLSLNVELGNGFAGTLPIDLVAPTPSVPTDVLVSGTDDFHTVTMDLNGSTDPFKADIYTYYLVPARSRY